MSGVSGLQSGDARQSETKSAHELLDAVEADVSCVIAELLNDVPRPKRLGLFAGEAALVRLKASFQCAIAIIAERYTFEAAVLLRLILEQMAWAYAVHDLEGKAVFRVRPTKAIGRLKAIFPQAGELYGTLSTYTHINPEITNQYLNVWGDGPPEVLYRDTVRSNFLALFLGVVADYYRVVAEAISYEHFRHPRASAWDGDNLRLLQERPLTEAIEIHRDFLRSRYRSEA
jgi:hypothetical protein